MQVETININKENLSYFDNKKGDITLLFIHGSFINKEFWNNQLSYFSEKYRVIAIDIAGHGNSSQNRQEWTIQNYGKDISEFIKRLLLKNVILIGHSIGADIMLETITNNPKNIIGLIGIDYFKNIGNALPENIIKQIVANLKSDFSNTCAEYAKQALLSKETEPELTEKIILAFREINPKVGISLNQNSFNYTQRETELLKELPIKIHLINVNYLPTNEVNLKKHIDGKYELYTLNGTCHYPMLENPNDFNISLEKILSKIKAN